MGKREKKRLEKRRREQEEREREEREREERERREREERERREREMMDERRRPIKATMALAIGSLVYYHCAYRNSSFVTLLADVFIVILCSLAVSGLFSRQMNIQVPVDPLEWQMTEETANTIVAGFANTVGAAESVLRVAATGHDKRLFFKVVISLIFFSAIGRIAPGHTVAYTGLWLFCLYIFVRCSRSVRAFSAWLFGTPNGDSEEQDPTL